MSRKVSILGATGSIGQSTIDLIRGRDDIAVVALSGDQNITRLAQDARALSAKFAVTADPALGAALAEALAGSGIRSAAGPEALIEAASLDADWIMSAIVGSGGLAPGLAALAQGTTLALANKESLVMAGPLLLAQAKASGAKILPVDSEHSAIFQALLGEDLACVEHLVITASGGPFRDWPFERLAAASLAEALRHPNWAMGQRITIDSASMFNKALEMIETREFFGVRPEQIEVLVHPESLVHALVSFVDGAQIAHLGAPDMRHAIGYALNWPDRRALPVARLDLGKVGTLRFEHPDPARFPALRLAREVMAMRGLAGSALIAAKDEALDAFIAGRIRFTEMAEVVEAVLDAMSAELPLAPDAMSLETVLQADRSAHEHARAEIVRVEKRR